MPKLTPGNKIKSISANDWNSFIDAAAWVKNNQMNQSDGEASSSRKDNICIIKNNSGSQLLAFTPVILSGLAIEPDADTGAPLICQPPAFAGAKPDSSNLESPTAILLDTVDAGKCCKAMLCGVSLVKLKINSSSDEFAEVTANGLETASTGAFRLLWKASATGSDKWAVAQFPYATGGGGTEVTLVQVKSVDSTAGTCKVASITMQPDSTPNYTSSSDSSTWTETYYLRS